MNLKKAAWILEIWVLAVFIGGIVALNVTGPFQVFCWIVLGIALVGCKIAEIIWWRCPHCHTYLWRVHFWWARCCPYCGERLLDEKNEWYTEYERLNYMQGDLQVFENGGKDMLLVTYKDGMQIHVGYDVQACEFVITVYGDSTEEAKANPLATHRVFGKAQLMTALQNIVHTWRDDKNIY